MRSFFLERLLLDPMLLQKKAAIDGLMGICTLRAAQALPWWAWTVWLAFAITIKRIENA